MAPAPDGCRRGSLAKVPSLLLGVEVQARTDALWGSSGTPGSSSDRGKVEAGCKTTVDGPFKESEFPKRGGNRSARARWPQCGGRLSHRIRRPPPDRLLLRRQTTGLAIDGRASSASVSVCLPIHLAHCLEVGPRRVEGQKAPARKAASREGVSALGAVNHSSPM